MQSNRNGRVRCSAWFRCVVADSRLNHLEAAKRSKQSGAFKPSPCASQTAFMMSSSESETRASLRMAVIMAGSSPMPKSPSSHARTASTGDSARNLSKRSWFRVRMMTCAGRCEVALQLFDRRSAANITTVSRPRMAASILTRHDEGEPTKPCLNRSIFNTCQGRMNLRHYRASARAHRQYSYDEHCQYRWLGGRLQYAKLALQPSSIKIAWSKMVLPSSSPADRGSDSYLLSLAE